MLDLTRRVLMMFFLFSCLGCGWFSYDSKSMDKNKLAAGPHYGIIYIVQIDNSDLNRVQKLEDSHINITQVNKDYIEAYVTQEDLGILNKLGMSYREVGRQGVDLGSYDDAAGGYVGYHNYKSLTEKLQKWAEDNSNLVRLTSLGKSVQGRELWAIKITDQPDVDEDEPEFKYIATMHGDEPLGTEMIVLLIDFLLTQYNQDTDVKDLVDNTEIWLVPLMNPDGLHLRQRYNALRYDLNRSFPGGGVTDTNRPIEVQHIMNWSRNKNFVLSANFHGGALVVNYPFDDDGRGSRFSPTADQNLIEILSKIYSFHNPRMWSSRTYSQGVVNGAQWYSIRGGMQDWNYRFTGNIEVTVELDDIKVPKAEMIPRFWDENKNSMLYYLQSIHRGIRGVVFDEQTQIPLRASIQILGNDHKVFTDSQGGDYQRLLLPGEFAVQFSAEGYEPKVFEEVIVDESSVTRLDVALRRIER